MKMAFQYFVLSIALLGMCAWAYPASAASGELVSRTLSHGGLDRVYLFYSPAGIAERKGPRSLLLVLHGGSGTAHGMVRITRNRFNELAEQRGFYVVYPQGIDKSWNEGRKGRIDGAHRRNIDDVGFLGALIDHLKSSYAIDTGRVFVTGMSNGGMMALRLGCSLPDKIRGIAPVVSSIPVDILALCQAPSNVSLVLFNGTRDPLVPYDGGTINAFGQKRGEIIAIERTLDLWRTKARCGATPVTRNLPDIAEDGMRVVRVEYRQCEADAKVVLYRIEGGGHTWPGGEQYLGERLVGRTSRDISAADELWTIFSELR